LSNPQSPRPSATAYPILLILLILCSLFLAPSLHASGKKDSGNQDTLNNEWILCVTAFDFSLLPPSRRIAGDIITRNLVDKFNAVNYRLRISPEYAYYEGYAWQQSVNAAARALSQKQDERSRLLYRGDPEWRYRNSLRRVDADIIRLQDDFNMKEANKPLINREPEFALLQANKTGTFPAPPRPGAERSFCMTQRADAFLTGEIREFHGRYYLRLRLFTLYTNSFVYEDDIIFSLDDTDGAINEIAARLNAVLAGSRPALVAVNADPPDSQILINQNYAGRGTVETRERPPGTIIVAVAAEGFTPQSVETELIAGEITTIDVTLSPLHYADVNILVPDKPGAAVYMGALYMGEAPYTLRLPIEQLSYVVVESGNEMGKAVFTSPDMPDEMMDVPFRTRVPPPSGEKRVNKARNWYYWTWGGTWIAGITAWVTHGMFTSQNEAMARGGYFDPEFFNNTQALSYISTGAIVAVGAIVVYKFYRLGRYLITATDNVTPIIKQEKPQ